MARVRVWAGEHTEILAVLAGGLVVRLALASLPGFATDIGLYRDWTEAISDNGPGNFYGDDPSKDYAPGYLYVLWLVGDLNSVLHLSEGRLEYVLKLPPIAADLAGAWLLYVLVRARDEWLGVGVAALYLALPPMLLVGAIWGQPESWSAFFVLLTIYLLVEHRSLAAGLAFTAGFLVKPQIVAAFPFLAFWFGREFPPRVWLRTALWSAGLALLLASPFFPSLLPWRPLVDLAAQVQDAAERHQFNAIFAANFWQARDIAGNCDVSVCHDDSGTLRYGTEYLGLSTRTWGIVLFLASCAVVVYVLRRTSGTGFLALGTSLCMLAFFAFMTRMHERYLFPFFLPFLVSCALLRSGALWRAFGILAAVYLLNVYDVYTDLGDLRIASAERWLEDRDLWGTGLPTAQLMGLVVCTILVALIVEAARLARHVQAEPGSGRREQAGDGESTGCAERRRTPFPPLARPF